MPNLEIQKNVGRWLAVDDQIEKTALQIPDSDGTYETEVGTISLEILEHGRDGDLQKIKLEGEALRGTPNKNRWRRKTARTLSLRDGYGNQTLSKREILIVRP